MLDTSRTRDKPGGPFGLIPIPKVAIGTIRGWREALQGTGFGTRVKMLVPGHLAYGKNPVQREGKAVVPVDAPMVFDVEIMGVEPAQAPAPVPAPPGTKLVPKGAGDGGERPAK